MAKGQKAGIRITRKGLVIWGGVIFFIAGWMFVLGILVGRGMAPVALEVDRLEDELSKIQSDLAQERQDELQRQDSGQIVGKQELGFYEALKEAKPVENFNINEPPDEERRVDKPAAPSQDAVSRSPKPAARTVKPPAKAAVEEKRISAPVKAEKPGPSKLPEPAKDAEGSQRYTIQVAAVKEMQGADRLVAELRRKGYPAYQIRSDVSGRGIWYRVRVGAYKNRAAAESMLSKLGKDKVKGLIVSTP